MIFAVLLFFAQSYSPFIEDNYSYICDDRDYFDLTDVRECYERFPLDPIRRECCVEYLFNQHNQYIFNDNSYIIRDTTFYTDTNMYYFNRYTWLIEYIYVYPICRRYVVADSHSIILFVLFWWFLYAKFKRTNPLHLGYLIKY